MSAQVDVKLVHLTIDGNAIAVPEGTLLVEAAKAVATDIPVYCYHPKLGPAGLCRICLVDVEKTSKLQIACNTTATEGMVVHTYGEKVDAGRKAVMEFLLLNHPLDCPICDKGGECDLQDFSMAYGASASRLVDAKSSKPKAIDLGPTIVLDDERCIVCQRCSRFDEIITNERSLVVKDRGQHDVISTASGEPYRSNFSGNVTELCPVGALTSKTYRFKSRPWDNVRTHTTCTQCSVGCALNIDERYGAITRTMSDENDTVSDGWLCDRGRYNIAFYGDARRITTPMLRIASGEFVQIGWDDAIDLWAKHLREAVASDGADSIAAIGGGRLLNEEILVLAQTMRALGVRHLDWRAGRQRQASPGAFGGTYVQLETADLVVAIGRPPSQTAPVLDLRIRKAVRNGARYVTVGSHAADSFVESRHLAHLSDLAPHLEAATRVAFVWDGIDAAIGAQAADLAESLAARGTHVTTFVASEQSNARGAESLGMSPQEGGADSDGIFAAARAGKLRVLSLLGVNPMLHHPLGASAVRDAIERTGFVVCTELFFTETAKLAHLVLPARAAFEKSGHVYDLAGDVLAVHAGHVAPEGTLADGDMFVALAAELDLAVAAPGVLLAHASAAISTTATAFGDPKFARAPDAHSSAIGSANGAKNGMRIAIATSVFSGGGTVYFDDRLGALRPSPTAAFARETAAMIGVHAGDLVDCVAGDRTLAGLVATIVEDAPSGVVTVIDGLPDAPANAFADGETVAIANVRSAETAQTVGAAR